MPASIGCIVTVIVIIIVTVIIVVVIYMIIMIIIKMTFLARPASIGLQPEGSHGQASLFCSAPGWAFLNNGLFIIVYQYLLLSISSAWLQAGLF